MNEKKPIKTYLVVTVTGKFEVKAESIMVEPEGVKFWIDGSGVVAFVSYNSLFHIIEKKDE